MKRAIFTLIAGLALAIPASALANPECPANMKPSGNARGGLLGSEVTLEVHVFNTEPNPIETPKGAVHWKVIQEGKPGAESLILAEPERFQPLPQEQLRAYGANGVGELAHTWEGVSRIWEGPWEVFFTEYVEVTGPGAEKEAPYDELNYDGVRGLCITGAAASKYTPPFYEGVRPTRFGEERPIR